MGRSVSYPSNAEVVVYTYNNYCDDFYEDFIEDICESCKAQWSSLSDCETWLDREDCAVLENAFCYIGISEYCGLIALWIVPKESCYNDNLNGLALHWIGQIEKKFRSMFGALRKVCTFSNGESIYKEITPNG